MWETNEENASGTIFYTYFISLSKFDIKIICKKINDALSWLITELFYDLIDNINFLVDEEENESKTIAVNKFIRAEAMIFNKNETRTDWFDEGLTYSNTLFCGLTFAVKFIILKKGVCFLTYLDILCQKIWDAISKEADQYIFSYIDSENSNSLDLEKMKHRVLVEAEYSLKEMIYSELGNIELTTLSSISQLAYESKAPKDGKITFVENLGGSANCNLIMLGDEWEFKEPRTIRKLLEVANSNIRLAVKIGSETPYIVAFEESSNDPEAKMINEYDVLTKSKISDRESMGEEEAAVTREKDKHNVDGADNLIGTTLASCNGSTAKGYYLRVLGNSSWELYCNGEPVAAYNKGKHFAFKYPIHEALDVKGLPQSVIEIVKVINEKAVHGAILIVFKNKDLLEEELGSIKRRKRGIVFNNPVSLYKDKEINSGLLERFASIDGAMIFDEDYKCYAIGVILDKYGASEFTFNIGRGSRFNSTGNYVNSFGGNGVYALTRSEDGGIDYFVSHKQD